MKLLTEEIRKKIPPLYSQENVKDPMVYVKFFTPWTSWTWYATEFDGKDIFFGWVVGLEKELGYFSLSEMESVRGPGGIGIERDMYFTPKPLSQVMAEYGEKWLMPQVRPHLKTGKKGPLYPHVPKSKTPLFPHTTRGQQSSGSQTWKCPKCGRNNEIYSYPTKCSRCGWLRELTERMPQTKWDPVIEKGVQFWNKVTTTQKAIMQNLGAKRILNIHDDGDVIFEANDGRACVLTTDGDLFIGKPRPGGNGDKSIELMPASISPEDRRLLSWVNEPLPPEAD